MKGKRVAWVDILKGVAIISVILGHRIEEAPTDLFKLIVKTAIYSYHMPLFFFLSGYVFSAEKYKNFKAFLYGKFRQLIIPLISFF